MFCPLCGKKIDAESEFCVYCGTPILPEHKNGVRQGGAPAFRLDKKKGILLAAAALVVALAVILPLALAGGGIHGSAEKVAAAYVESVHSLDFKRQVECFPEFYVRNYARWHNLSDKAGAAEVAKELERRSGRDEKEKIKILSVKTMRSYSPRNTDLFRMNGATQEENRQIQEAYRMRVSFSDSAGDEYYMEVVSLKLDGKWYAIPSAL